MPYVEHGFNSYLPRHDERMGVWLFSFLSDTLTQEKNGHIYYKDLF